MIQAKFANGGLLAADGGGPALRLLQEIPGVVDIAWAVLARLAVEHDPARLVFTSAGRGSGNTVLAAATAIALVRHARVPVCLIEADVEHPALAQYLGLQRTGLSDVLDGRAELRDCLQSPAGCPGLFVLPSGTSRRPVSGEFAGERMRSVLERVGALGRYLVIDAPCLLAQLDARVLLQRADCAVLVLRADVTSLDDADRVHRIVQESGTPLLGSIFNAYGSARAFARVDPYVLSPGDLARAEPAVEPAATVAPVPPVPPGPPGPDLAGVPVLRDDLQAGGDESATPNGNGGAVHETSSGSDEGLRHEVDLLERRIAKLSEALSRTEAELVRISAAKHVDLGVASSYRNVQGLSAEAEALSLKKELMQKLFEANLQLRQATRRVACPAP